MEEGPSIETTAPDNVPEENRRPTKENMANAKNFAKSIKPKKKVLISTGRGGIRNRFVNRPQPKERPLQFCPEFYVDCSRMDIDPSTGKFIIPDYSTDEYVVPSTLDEEEVLLIEPTPLDVPPPLRSSVAIELIVYEGEDFTPSWSTGDEEMAVDGLSPDEWVRQTASTHRQYFANLDNPSIEMNFTTHPVKLRWWRDNRLRPALIDGCALARQFNPAFKATWVPRPDGITTKTQILPTRPLVLLALRFTLMGAKAIILLPHYYKSDSDTKVDDPCIWQILVDLGLVQFLEELDAKRWHKLLLLERQKFGGVLVSSSAFQRHVNRARQQAQISGSVFEPTIIITKEDYAEAASHSVTAYFMGRARQLVLPLHVSTKNNPTFLGSADIFYFPPDTAAEFADPLQITVGEQLELVSALDDLVELPKSEVRAVQIIKRASSLYQRTIEGFDALQEIMINHQLEAELRGVEFRNAEDEDEVNEDQEQIDLL